MRTREGAKKSDARCRHFNGIQNGKCESKIEYPKWRLIPCFGEVECDGYSPLNVEELAAKEADHQRHMDLMRQGLSSCCEAPFNVSHVITKGQFKNHGPRFCSKCKRCCFMV